MNVVKLLREAGSDFMEDRALRLAAALAYYSVFSLAPLMIIIISLGGLIFGEEAVRGHIEGQLQGVMGQEAAGAIHEMIAGAQRSGATGIMAVVGIVLLLFSAGGVFGQLQDAINTVWDVKPKTGGGIWGAIRARFLSFAMVLGVGFLLLISLVLSAMLAALSGWLGSILPLPEAVLWVLNIVISVGLIVLLIAMIFKWLPDATVLWRDVWFGAAVTAGLFVIGKLLLGWYLGRQNLEATYGAAGALVLILMWVYYSSVILLFGAEVTQAKARLAGRKIDANADDPTTPNKSANKQGSTEKAAAVKPATS